MNQSPDLKLLTTLGVVPEGAEAGLSQLYAGAVEALKLPLVDYLTGRDLLALAGYNETPLHALLLCLFAALNEGSLCVRLEQQSLRQRLGDFMPTGAEAMAEQILARIGPDSHPELVGRQCADYKPLVWRETPAAPYLYFHKYLAHEEMVRERLQSLLAADLMPAAEPEAAAPAIAAVLEDLPVRRRGRAVQLDNEQKLALGLSLLTNFLVISGGPGTGKTAIVIAVLRCLVRLGVAPDRILLGAPTGRAAQRMTETLQQALGAIAGNDDPDDAALAAVKARTIHQLLGYRPATNAFRHCAANPLPAEVLIVDEVSMVDALLMGRLLDAVGAETRVVFLGDKDQLPSVEAGAVLADLIPRLAQESYSAAVADRLGKMLPDLEVPAAAAEGPLVDRLVILRRSYRSESRILAVADAVNHRRAAVLRRLPLLPTDDPAGALAGLTGGCAFMAFGAAARARWHGLLEAWGTRYFLEPLTTGKPSYLDRVKAASELAWDTDEQDLAPEVQKALQQLFDLVERSRILCLVRRGAYGCISANQYLDWLLRPRLDPGSGESVFAGAPIIICRNDPVRDLYNGEVGVVLRSDDGPYRAVFARHRGFASFAVDVLPPFEPAFAITVHKSQGSEYDHVLLALPEASNNRLLSKEIIYTGLTRARRSVLIAGSSAAFAKAVARRVERESGLDLWGLGADPTAAPEQRTPETLKDLPLFAEDQD